MTKDEIKQNAPESTTHYLKEDYFPVDYWKKDAGKFYLWDGEKWSLYPYQHHKSLSFINPL